VGTSTRVILEVMKELKSYGGEIVSYFQKASTPKKKRAARIV
jgi:hypothetical protein